MIEAIGDKVIVKLMRRNQTSGGIILPNNSADPQGYGKILSIGPDVPTWDKDQTKNLKIGDIIVFHIRAGMDLLMDKEILRTLKYDEIYGILRNKEFASNLEEIVITGNTEGTPLIQPAGGGIIAS
jgi:co-chaperonin GroES (HSP10)